MSKQLRVVIVGKSPLSLLICQQLDKYLGPLVQYDITWLTDGDELVTDLLEFDPVGRFETVDIKKALNNVRLRVGTVKSVNLRTEEIITTRGSVKYDFLLLDQIPYYSAKELSTIYRQFATLIGAVAAARDGEKSISASAVIGGRSASSWQLALSLRSFQLRHYPTVLRNISVHVDKSPDAVKEFLHEHSVTSTASKSEGGIRIAAPAPMIVSKLIKGARLDRSGHIVADAMMRVRGFDNVICFDSPEWLRSNMLRVYRSLSAQISKLVENFFEGKSIKKLHIPSHSLLLRSHRGKLAMVGKMNSKNFRAALIAKLEDALRA